MSYIYDASGDKVGRVEESGKVYGLSGSYLGKIADDKVVYDESGKKMGHIDMPIKYTVCRAMLAERRAMAKLSKVMATKSEGQKGRILNTAPPPCCF